MSPSDEEQVHEYDDVCSTPERVEREKMERRGGEQERGGGEKEVMGCNIQILILIFFLLLFLSYLFFSFIFLFPSTIAVASTIATSCEQINRIFRESEDQGPRASGCKRLRGRSSIPFMPLPTLLSLLSFLSCPSLSDNLSSSQKRN